MLDYAKSGEIAFRVARKTLGKENVVRVFTEPMFDAEGNDALRVNIVIQPDMLDHVDGKALIQTLMKLNKNLREAGEDRQSVVFYATEEELATSDEPEP